MKKIIALLAFSILAFACSSKKEGNMIVKGQIKGLKKGTLYLQKMKDTNLISVDSMALLGNDTFILSDNVSSPVMYYLTFDGNTKDKHLMFFGEQGEITINDNLEEFGFNPEIKGSKNQDILQEFRQIDNKFKDQRLDFIKRDFEARQAKNDTLVKKLETDYKKMMRRRFLFSTNFAIAHADNEVAPYIALSELFDANLVLLDTINNSLSDNVKSSDYGKRLQKFITEIKAKK
ncbi:DUF4369 domain-containing protein [Tenacibaculum piscium]|uniref:Thiol:disulfide interchange protein n=1 Tax=Tenacibaculum piscium TaxID=1458515 RepID=A0A2H1YFB6_9FLAO|nr:DUF4369 domain-containing protein [Tenacibaculum piscium]MBE7629028.1 DUF4369 domain-containing protein [Tenacibaculum piscium]MBE7670472.1 DUF4369 domain-containing protein [Tenacibaculum piscium]MBE7684951.1 DUF4369 domain-containing protein [Tenacibaculum piscium]MBE7689654.1 DUF4369 domain-containing protein [Tenacibaculum piscium]MCG8183520.1 DUF4369 domain-containing protein [Tenacibaculum piscium]